MTAPDLREASASTDGSGGGIIGSLTGSYSIPRRTGAASAALRRAAGGCSGTARRVAGPRVHARRVARHGAFLRHRSRARWCLVVGRSHPRPGAADRFVRRRCALRHARSRRRARIGGQARACPRGDPPRHRGVGRGAATRRQQHRDARAVPAHRGPLRAGRPLRRPVARVLRRGASGCGRRPFARPVRARLDGALESARPQRSGAPARQPLAADDRRAHARGRHGELPPAVHGAADPRCPPRQAPRRARRTRRHDLRLVLAPGRPRPLRRVLRRHAAAAAVPPRAIARPDARRAARFRHGSRRAAAPRCRDRRARALHQPAVPRGARRRRGRLDRRLRPAAHERRRRVRRLLRRGARRDRPRDDGQRAARQRGAFPRAHLACHRVVLRD